MKKLLIKYLIEVSDTLPSLYRNTFLRFGRVVHTEACHLKWIYFYAKRESILTASNNDFVRHKKSPC